MVDLSINASQRARTATELKALRAQLPVSDQALCERLGYPDSDHLNAVLNVEHADPAQVWQLRDFLCALAAKRGVDTPEFSVLQEHMRPMAQQWFGTWTVPSVEGL